MPAIQESFVFRQQGSGVPSMTDLEQYVVNRDGWEAVRQTLYDYQLYPAAGSAQMTFFSVPQGQGLTVQAVGAAPAAGTTKTLSDTNMTLAGQLPAQQNFLVQSVEVMFYPNVYHVTNAVGNPATISITTAAALAPAIVNDEYIFRKSGNLIFTIGSKQYLQEAPMGRFPPKTNFGVSGSIAGWIGATLAESYEVKAVMPQSTGRPYMIHPASLLLNSSQNFSVTLNWPEGLQAVTYPAKVGVVLDGFLYRRSQ